MEYLALRLKLQLMSLNISRSKEPVHPLLHKENHFICYVILCKQQWSVITSDHGCLWISVIFWFLNSVYLMHDFAWRPKISITTARVLILIAVLFLVFAICRHEWSLSSKSSGWTRWAAFFYMGTDVSANSQALSCAWSSSIARWRPWNKR